MLKYNIVEDKHVKEMTRLGGGENIELLHDKHDEVACYEINGPDAED